MFNIDNTPTNVCAICRPPPTERNGLKTSDFLDEWRTFISEQSTLSPDLILVGDINIHMDNPSSHYTPQFNQTLAATGFQQHIHVPTHHHGHTLDILVSRDDSSIVNTVAVVDIGLCDNDGNIIRDLYAIRISINRSVKQPHYETISFRNYKHIDEETFKKTLKTWIS